jgi:hypothetical protein
MMPRDPRRERERDEHRTGVLLVIAGILIAIGFGVWVWNW